MHILESNFRITLSLLIIFALSLHNAHAIPQEKIPELPADQKKEGEQSKAITLEASVQIINVSNDCQHGLQEFQNKPFAMYVFCDDAVGNQIGFIWTRAGISDDSIPQNQNKWSEADRFWQEKPWAQDVVDVAILKTKNVAIVSTENIYSQAGIWLLDLNTRSYKALPFQTKKFKISDVQTMLNIVSIDENNKKVHISIKQDPPSGSGLHAEDLFLPFTLP